VPDPLTRHSMPMAPKSETMRKPASSSPARVDAGTYDVACCETEKATTPDIAKRREPPTVCM
jgi:hypothetical protein